MVDGFRGPVPKRSEARRRRNRDPEGSVELVKVNLDDLIAGEVEIPLVPEDWDPITLHLWDSLAKSGQAIFYEPGDWATALAVCEVLDRWLKPQEVKVGEEEYVEVKDNPKDPEDPFILKGKRYLYEEKILPMPGGVLTSILKGLASLMVTEGDRRRLRIELDRKKAQDAILSGGNVVSIVANREELFKSASKG